MTEQSHYETEIKRFSELLKTNRQYAFDRYGWTFFHSIPAEERHQLRHELGWNDKTALDFYNSGAMSCRAGKVKDGLALMEKAESMGLDIPEMWYNLGLAYDQEGDMAKARSYYEKFVNEIEARVRVPVRYRDDLDEIRERLSQM